MTDLCKLCGKKIKNDQARRFDGDKLVHGDPKDCVGQQSNTPMLFGFRDNKRFIFPKTMTMEELEDKELNPT